MATFGVTETTGTELDQLIASEFHLQKEITLKASAGALVRGTVLEMVSIGSGQYQQLQASNGANARAILAQDAADSAATQKVQAYFAGKYRESDITWPAGITTQQKYTAVVGLADKGIILDTEMLSIVTSTTTTTTSSTTSTTTTTAP